MTTSSASTNEVAFRVPLSNACGVAYSPPHAPGASPFAFVACKEEGVFGVELQPAPNPKAKRGTPPPEPTARGSLAAPGMDARRLSIEQGRLFVAGGAGGLHIYDIRNPNHPMPLSKIVSAAIPVVENVFAWGGYAFVVGGDGVNARFAVVDARNIAQPGIVGGYTHVSRDASSYMSIGFDGRFMYLGTDRGELHVMNLANLAHVSRVGEFFCPKSDFRTSMLAGILAFPGRVFCADWGAGMIVVDTTNPLNPRQLGIFQGGTTVANPYRIAVEGTVAYVANGWGGLLAVDVAGYVGTPPPNYTPHLLWEVAPQRASFVDIALARPYVLLADNGNPQSLAIVRMR